MLAIFINISFSVTYTLTKKNFPLFWLAFLLSLSLVLHLSLCCIFRHGGCLASPSTFPSPAALRAIVQLVALLLVINWQEENSCTHTARKGERKKDRITDRRTRGKLLQLDTHICSIYIYYIYTMYICYLGFIFLRHSACRLTFCTKSQRSLDLW